MNAKIDIWLVGNTGLRNPNRIQEGLAVFANSSYVGKLHGRDHEMEADVLQKRFYLSAGKEKRRQPS